MDDLTDFSNSGIPCMLQLRWTDLHAPCFLFKRIQLLGFCTLLVDIVASFRSTLQCTKHSCGPWNCDEGIRVGL